MSFCTLTDNLGNSYQLASGDRIASLAASDYFCAIDALPRIDYLQLSIAEDTLFRDFHGNSEWSLLGQPGPGWPQQDGAGVFSARPSHPHIGMGFLPGRWPQILDAIYLGNLRFIQTGAAKPSKSVQPRDNRSLLRVKIRQALLAIVAIEQSEAAHHTRSLGQQTPVNRGLIYTGAFLTGLWRAGKDFAQWLQEVNDVVSPLQCSLRGVRATHRALQRSETGEGLLDAYQAEMLTAEKREIVQVLGFDPTAITREQFQRATELADLIWDDPALQADLRRFVKDYVRAQHAIEITEFSGAAAFEVLFTILLVAVTGGVGLAASAAGLSRHFARFRKAGELLVEFGEQVKVARQRLKKNSVNKENGKPGFENFPAEEVVIKKDPYSGEGRRERGAKRSKLESSPEERIIATVRPENIDWQNSGPNGLVVNDPRDFEVGKEIYDSLLGSGLEPDMAFRISRELLESGTGEPSRFTVKKGERLYKVVPRGGNPPGEKSPYFMTKEMLDRLPENAADAGDFLGLPQVPDSFDVYEMIATEDVITYQSEIAEFSVNGGEFLRSGGGVQTLVIDRDKFTGPVKL